MAEVDAVACAWVALGRQLAASRRAARLSQHRLAELTEYGRSTVANTETGRQRAPRDYWVRCDKELGGGTALARGYDQVIGVERHAEVAEAAAARAARGAHLGVAAARVVATDDGDGAEALRVRLEGALGGGAPRVAGLEAWEESVAHLGRESRCRPPGELLVGLSTELAELEQAIRECRSVAALRRLVRLAAQLSGLMCLIYVKHGDQAAFRRWAATARSAAMEAGDRFTLSWVLAQEAYGHYYAGDLRAAVGVAREAQDVVRRPCVGAALAAALEARAHAARGDERLTVAALGRAEGVLGALDAGSLAASAFGYSESQFRFHESSAYTRLGNTRAAVRAQERLIEVCPPGDYTDLALTRLDRASCLLHDGDPAGAVDYAAQAMVGLTGAQRAGIITARAGELLRAVPSRYGASAQASELRDLLRAPEGGLP